MSIRIWIMIALVVLVATGSTSVRADPKEGQLAPDFSVTTLDGRQVNLQSLKNKVIILNYWATWCGPCRSEMPALEAYYRAHRREGLEIIALSQDDADQVRKVKALAKSYAYPFALKAKSDTKAYGPAAQLPMSFVIDRKGILRADGSHRTLIFTPQLLASVVTPLLKN